MTRLPYLPWCDQIGAILQQTAIVKTRDLELMFAAGFSPVEAAAAIAVIEFERTINQ